MYRLLTNEGFERKECCSMLAPETAKTVGHFFVGMAPDIEAINTSGNPA